MSWASATWKLSKGWWPLVWHWWPRSTGKLKRFTAVRCAVLSWKQEPFKPRFALWDAKRLERSPQSSPRQGSTKGVGNAVKLIGAGLVLFSGLLAGILAAARLQRRARLLLDWMTLLQNFQTGIRYSAGSLRELILERQESRFCRLAERDGEFLIDPVGALSRAGEELLWDRGDREMYLGFVKELGATDVQGQLEHIAMYQGLLAPRLEQAQTEARQKSKISVALGLFAGVAMSLLLL